MRSISQILVAAVALGFVVAGGCLNPYEPLPKIELASPPPGIPAGAAPVHSWHARTPVLKTFWGDQELEISCRGHFPAGWRHPGDERWEVRCANQKGTALPFLGILRRYQNTLGQPASEVLPAFDINALEDGLYLLVESGIQTAPAEDAGAEAPPAIREIRPTAELIEVRRHQIWPFRIRIPLVPDAPSALTPVPPEAGQDQGPRGTIIP